MSDPCGSISGAPSTIHSATVPAAAPRSSGPRRRPPTRVLSPPPAAQARVAGSGLQRDQAVDRVADAGALDGRGSRASARAPAPSAASKSSEVNGSSVGESSDSSSRGDVVGRHAGSAGARRSRPPCRAPCWRSYMFVSMSRTIGKAISPGVCSKSGIGPTRDHLVHGRRERDRGAGHARDPRAPDAAADEDVPRPRSCPRSVWTRRTRPFSTSIPVTSVLGETVSAPSACAASRISVPGARPSRRRRRRACRSRRAGSRPRRRTARAPSTCAGVSSSESARPTRSTR